MPTRYFTIIALLTLVACQPATIAATPQSPTITFTSLPTDTQVPQPTVTETLVSTPTIPASTIELNGAEVQPGFSLIKFADLYRPTAITFDAQGRMFVTSQDGNVYILSDD